MVPYLSAVTMRTYKDKIQLIPITDTFIGDLKNFSSGNQIWSSLTCYFVAHYAKGLRKCL